MTPYQLGFVHGNNGSKLKDIYDEPDELEQYHAGHESGKENAVIVARNENERFADYVKQK